MASIQDLWSGKTSKARSRPIKARISDVSLKHSRRLKIPQLLFLNLKMANGMAREALWEMVTPSLGEPWTLSIGEFPKEENVSTLSQILEENVPEKFYLSRKACLGILRRASARGKELPAVLKKALEEQAAYA